MQRVTITGTRYHKRYCTFSLSLTWVDHNAMHYHNFNVLPHATTYIFAKFSLVLGIFATCYHEIYKRNAYQYFFKKSELNRGNALQINSKPW